MANATTYAAVLAAYTRWPGKHTQVAKATGVSVNTCTNLWNNGDGTSHLTPIRLVVDAATKNAPILAGATVAQEIIAEAFNLSGMEDAVTTAKEAKAMAQAVVESSLATIRANAAKALAEEQAMIAAGRNAVHGVYALISRTLAALQTVLSKCLDQIANTDFESPREALAMLETITGILHQAGLAAKNVQEMERSMLTASGWEAPGTEKVPAEGKKPAAAAGSIEDSIRTITQAAELCKGLGSLGQKLSATDVPYQEETGS